MNDHHHRFITYLQSLATRDRGALAALRRSLGFTPGTFAAAMPIVEPFVAPWASEWSVSVRFCLTSPGLVPTGSTATS